MPSPRSRPAAKPAARSPSRARTGPVAARKTTLSTCAKPVDETIRIDPSDNHARERVARVLTRSKKVEGEADKAAAKTTKRKSASSTAGTVAPKISTSKIPTSKLSASKTPAPKTAASKVTASKTSAARTAATKQAAPARSSRAKASADEATAPTAAARKAASEPASPEPPQTAETDASVVVAESEVEVSAPADTADAADAAEAPRRRGPSGVTRTAVDRLEEPPPESGVPLIDHVSRAVEREITQIAVIVGGHHLKQVQRTEAERRARTLASLARTLAELRKLRSDEDRKRARDDDAIPRDLDELRRALSRRLDEMVAGAARLPAAGDE